MIKRVLVMLFLLGLSATLAAKTLYVVDEIRVGLREEANSTSKIVGVADTGTALDVLDTQGSYILVKTESGKQGWIHKNYTLEELPAKLRIDAVIAAGEKLKGEIGELKQTIAQLDTSRDSLMGEKNALQTQLQTREADIAQLREQLATYTGEAGNMPPLWLILVGAAVLLFAVGMLLGYNMYKRKVAQRLGGLHF